MDYLGAILIASGLILLVFSITQSAHAPHGWRTPYIPVCLVVGILSLLCAAYVEARVASQPLLPPSIVLTPSMTPLLISILIIFASFTPAGRRTRLIYIIPTLSPQPSARLLRLWSEVQILGYLHTSSLFRSCLVLRHNCLWQCVSSCRHLVQQSDCNLL